MHFSHFSQFRVAFSLKRKKDYEHYISEWHKLLKYVFLGATVLFYYVFFVVIANFSAKKQMILRLMG